MHAAPRRELELVDLHPDPDDFLGEVKAGLHATHRTLPCKYLYDERGSRLFDRITELDEYYPTRTEISILRENVGEIVEKLDRDVLLVEFGSGSSLKTRLLLDHLPRAAGYVPVDISREHLLQASKAIRERYPSLEVLPVCADFTRPIDLPEPSRPAQQRVVFFPGSTIGNFTHDEAADFLRTVADDAGSEGGLLVGVDLRKDRRVLERAYDDSDGVTAAFNLNLLRRINRELGADFDLDGFEHEVVWDEAKGRIEMHLRSSKDQVVHVDGESFEFSAGQTIHTENSHKYSVEEFAELARGAGLRLDTVWTDPRDLFSVQLYWVDEAA